MKRLILPLALFIITSCNNGASTNSIAKQNNEVAEPVHHPVPAFVIKFKNDHPNWTQNEVVHENIDKIFADSVIAMYQKPNILSGYAFKLTSTGKYGENGKTSYYAVFNNENDSSIKDAKIYLQILAKVSDSMINNLKEDSIYRIKEYKYIDYKKNEGRGLTKRDYSSDYYLGSASVEIKSFE